MILTKSKTSALNASKYQNWVLCYTITQVTKNKDDIDKDNDDHHQYDCVCDGAPYYISPPNWPHLQSYTAQTHFFFFFGHLQNLGWNGWLLKKQIFE